MKVQILNTLGGEPLDGETNRIILDERDKTKQNKEQVKIMCHELMVLSTPFCLSGISTINKLTNKSVSLEI